MRYVAPALLLSLSCAAPAQAACYADYKAKQDAPLRLAYGVAAVLAPRLAAAGWTLLSIVSIFGPEGLDERKESAGAFFLRY